MIQQFLFFTLHLPIKYITVKQSRRMTNRQISQKEDFNVNQKRCGTMLIQKNSKNESGFSPNHHQKKVVIDNSLKDTPKSSQFPSGFMKGIRDKTEREHSPFKLQELKDKQSFSCAINEIDLIAKKESDQFEKQQFLLKKEQQNLEEQKCKTSFQQALSASQRQTAKIIDILKQKSSTNKQLGINSSMETLIQFRDRYLKKFQSKESEKLIYSPLKSKSSFSTQFNGKIPFNQDLKFEGPFSEISSPHLQYSDISNQSVFNNQESGGFNSSKLLSPHKIKFSQPSKSYISQRNSKNLQKKDQIGVGLGLMPLNSISQPENNQIKESILSKKFKCYFQPLCTQFPSRVSSPSLPKNRTKNFLSLHISPIINGQKATIEPEKVLISPENVNIIDSRQSQKQFSKLLENDSQVESSQHRYFTLPTQYRQLSSTKASFYNLTNKSSCIASPSFLTLDEPIQFQNNEKQQKLQYRQLKATRQQIKSFHTSSLSKFKIKSNS